MSSIESVVDGNTRSTTRIPSSKYWVFTLNNPTLDEFDILKKEICLLCLDYRVQEEIGACGTPHLQGFIQGKKPMRPIESFSCKRMHWEKARTPALARAYCTKSDTATGKYIMDTADTVELIEPKGWMIEVLSILSKKPDYRTIHWYWDEHGNTGKSAFTKYLCHTLDALCVSGKSGDCKYAVIKYHEDKKRYPRIIIFDVPRTNLDYINYEAIESIKNGCFFSGKYESGQVIMNCPHVLIFANMRPNTNKLSKDRWNIVDIDSKKPMALEVAKTLYNTSNEMTLIN